MAALAIPASGMVTPVGFNFPASCAAMRAGIRNVNQIGLFDRESGEFLGVGKVPLPHWWIGLGKLAELAAPAILECLRAAEPMPASEVPVLLGIAGPDRPHRVSGLEEELVGEIEHRLGFRLHPASHVIARDHVAAIVGLREAAELFSKKEATHCVVAGVDSLIQQDLAEYYLSKRRLLTSQNSNGFCPGEAGAAVLVRLERGDSDELRVLGTGMAREEATIESEEPLRGEGLTSAIGEAFSQSRLTYDDMHYRITDLNGEHYKFKEMTLAMLRYQRKPKPKLFDLWHPIEHIGDVGAAIGPLVLGVALHAGQKSYGNGPTVLCTFGNDEGERAAAVVSYHRGGR